MRGIAVSDDAGSCGARLRSLRVDVLDLRHEAIRVSADMRQVFPGEIGDLGKGGDAVFVTAADGLLQPDPHHAGTNLAAAGKERFIDEAGIGHQAGRRQRDLNGHILTAAQQIEHSHVLARLLLPLLLAVFALWLLWWLLTQALPLWRNNRAYRAKEARLREQTAAANGGGQLADALLCHVNYRITAMLRAAYPNARWEWLADKPSRFAVEGGTARIRVYGIPDFDYADVKLDQKANLDCSLVKLSPLVTGASDTQPPNRQPVNPRVWFETRGRAVLEALVTDLNSRGHSSLTVQENGEVFVQAKENEAEPAKEIFLDFPEKVYWPQLVKVLEEEGYAADARDANILVSW